MFIVGIQGANGIGKSTTAEALRDELDEILEGVGVVVYRELSEKVEELHRYLRVNAADRSVCYRESAVRFFEAGMELDENIWMDAILGDAVDTFGDDISVLIICGVRRENEAKWIKDHGGKVMHIHDTEKGFTEMPEWYRDDDWFCLAPHEEKHREDLYIKAMAIRDIVVGAATPLTV
ncbi:MAG: hypothetical protein JXR97_12305 [Planctomycetes bacterium]|nr:hypothetical protein [Planctomycetota bacterium]